MEQTVFDALVIGSGAAGFAAAVRLAERGLRAAILTENVNAGTSRNAGSDKQTYYKLGLAGGPDGVMDMARDLFACGCTDGDTALAEAALSARCFFRLAELGVPFPCTPFGEYAGYKTDHDPRARASSAGPLTSKLMTEALEKRAAELGVPVLDGRYAADLLTDGSGVLGVGAIDTKTGGYTAFPAKNVILATGGPAGIYARSVYPESQTGSASLALRAGATLQNLTEWQYGLASLSPRWNVSGSYMQALPRFISVDAAGNEREFLTDCFDSPAEALAAAFLKGYQWPFDSKKAQTGSSRVDLAVFSETVQKGRRVYLDFTQNPFGCGSCSDLPVSDEAKNYLHAARATGETPIERLRALNEPAYQLYLSKGVDLAKEPLEIALCAQHMNGGVSVDAHWQTDIPGLYAVGECAGTHGPARPGGSALNAGQVGALRAAGNIARTNRPAPEAAAFQTAAKKAEEKHEALLAAVAGESSNVNALLAEARSRFDSVCAAIRDVSAFPTEAARISGLLQNFETTVKIKTAAEAVSAYRLLDALWVQLAVLTACGDCCKALGGSRGGAIYIKSDDPFGFDLAADPAADKIQTLKTENGTIKTGFRPVRPIPESDLTFETVWREYRERNREQTE